MKTLIILAVLATAAFAGIVEYGPQVGYWAPTGDAGDIYSGNLYLGGQILVHMPMLAVEGSVGYVSLNPDDAGVTDFSGHIIPVTAGIRSYMGPLYAAGGLELDMTTSDFFPEEDLNDFSGYLGVGVVPAIPFMADIDASARLHFVDFSDMWVGITVGLNF